MATKLQVIETYDVDVSAGTEKLREVRVSRKAGSPIEFKQAALDHLQNKMGATTFDLIERAIYYMTADEIKAQAIEEE